MNDKSILVGVVILVAIYLIYTKYYENFLGDRQMNGMLQYDLASSKGSVENFLGDRQMNGMLQYDLSSSRGSVENFSNYDEYNGSYESDQAEYNEVGGNLYTEYMRSSVDPSLNRRQKQFITDLNRGDYSKATASIVNTAKYEQRESQAANGIGLRAPRAVPINYNQKQVPELTMDSAYAQHDAIFGARVLNTPGGYA